MGVASIISLAATFFATLLPHVIPLIPPAYASVVSSGIAVASAVYHLWQPSPRA